MLAPADANTDMATNVDVNGAEPQQHTAVRITTTAVSPIPKVAGHIARKSHRRWKTCIITLNPSKREQEQKKKTSNKSANDEPRPSKSGQDGSRLKSTKPIDTSRPNRILKTRHHACIAAGYFQTVKVARNAWIKCGVCKAWAHEDCEGDAFTCEMCDDQ